MTLLTLAAVLMLPAHGGWFSGTQRGAAAAGFLELGVGARALAMGEAASASADDATAIYWNPGAMTRVKGSNMVVMYAPYLDSSSFGFGGYVRRVGAGAFGVGVQYFEHGRIRETDIDGRTVGEFSPRDISVGAGYARSFGWGSVGAAAKFVRSTIRGSAQTGAFDIGFLSEEVSDRRLRLGVTASHLGRGLEFRTERSPLPSTIRTGLSLEAAEPVLIALEGVFPRSNSPYGAAGVEFTLLRESELRVVARAGINGRSIGDISGVAGFTSGVGVASAGLSADYAIVPMGGLGITHRISLSLRWGAPKRAQARPAPEPVAVKPARSPSPSIATAGGDIDCAAKLDTVERRIMSKDIAGARESLLEAESILPVQRRHRLNIRYLELKGRLAFIRREFGEAKRSYEEAVTLAGELGFRNLIVGEAYAGLGRTLLAQGDADGAVSSFEKALQVGPSAATRRVVESLLAKVLTSRSP